MVDVKQRIFYLIIYVESEDEDERDVMQRQGNTNLCNCKNQNCVTSSTEFKTLCLGKFVLKNVLVGLHETNGDPLEKKTN